MGTLRCANHQTTSPHQVLGTLSHLHEIDLGHVSAARIPSVPAPNSVAKMPSASLLFIPGFSHSKSAKKNAISLIPEPGILLGSKKNPGTGIRNSRYRDQEFLVPGFFLEARHKRIKAPLASESAAADTSDQNLIKLYGRYGCTRFVVMERIVGGPYQKHFVPVCSRWNSL